MSALNMIIAALVATSVACAGGVVLGIVLFDTIQPGIEASSASDKTHKSGKKGGAKKKSKDKKASKSEDAGGPKRYVLDPILTNLKAPKRTFVRLEGVINVKSSHDDDEQLLDELSQDLLNHLRSISLNDLQGRSGLANLRADLSDIVRLRFKGRAKGITIRGLAIE